MLRFFCDNACCLSALSNRLNSGWCKKKGPTTRSHVALRCDNKNWKLKITSSSYADYADSLMAFINTSEMNVALFYIRTQLSRPFTNRCCWCCIVYFHISHCAQFGFRHGTNAERNNHADHISRFANHVVFAIQQFQMFIVFGYAKMHSAHVHSLHAGPGRDRGAPDTQSYPHANHFTFQSRTQRAREWPNIFHFKRRKMLFIPS